MTILFRPYGPREVCTVCAIVLQASICEMVSIAIVVVGRHETNIANDCSIFGIVAVVALLEESLLGGLRYRERHSGEGGLRRGRVMLLQLDVIEEWT